MEGPISFWGYKEQESNLILPEHDNDDDDINLKLEIKLLKQMLRRIIYYNNSE